MPRIPQIDTLAVKASAQLSKEQLGFSRLAVKPNRPIYFVKDGTIIARMYQDRQTGYFYIEAQPELSIIREGM